MVVAKDKSIWTVGRRKTSVARIKLVPGTGKIIVNQKEIREYIHGGEGKVEQALKPLKEVGVQDKYDIYVNVRGGGVTGQVGAISHGISRALALIEPGFRSILKKGGYLTRDSRMVERKKYGRHKARRGTQFSKR